VSRSLAVYRLGRVSYADALALQERLVDARKDGRGEDVLLLLEHPKVITLGRAAKQANILLSDEALAAQGYEVFATGRGGDVTFHGPGQLVGYPIIDLKPERQDVRRYVQDLEETMIRVCADYGLEAGRSPGKNGAWIGDRKVGAVGVRISRWVTMHGFALNVTTELASFGAIVPCGIPDRGVTSLSAELGYAPDFDDVQTKAASHLASLLGATWRNVSGPPDFDS
jgi:lipoyl(octanoyl) transferase